MRGRKAITQRQLVVLIVATLCFIILLTVVADFVGQLLNRQGIEACRTSLIAASTGKVPVVGKTMDFDCERRDVEITEDDVAVGGNVNKQEIKYRMAEELRRCNYMTGEGSIDPYKKEALQDTGACLICSEVSFSEGLSDVDKDLTGLDLYSYIKEAGIEKDEQDGTYIEYLRKNRGEKAYSKKPYKAIQNISVEEEYYVLQMLTHSASWWFWQGSWSSNDEMSSAIVFIKKQDLHEVGCDYIVN